LAPAIEARLLGLPEGAPITPEQVECVKMGTTVATNALLERNGEPTLLVTTRGFRDALRIAYQNRPRIFERHIHSAAEAAAKRKEDKYAEISCNYHFFRLLLRPLVP